MKGNLRSSPKGIGSVIMTKLVVPASDNPLHDFNTAGAVLEKSLDTIGTAPETSEMGRRQLARSAFPVAVE